ncbi:hypothetical protein M8756_16600 [Lutimaribacter sp. EGI FJ00015]|uniref:Uncharacterized protein n=1 Tax=Lutimaribacter degradans TaxID=2945989 RepID=A0ACC5ZZL4_9RHOB|nr:hypothetical protein [Lutimaribacter sp. EGI FJ00013]MCM2563747.1 hypothetical protein [Lutimaribacter sp. EGI FJ00013]MCO0614932.1 hypothetical protein [Lutimaribacter sp. EGI FJ00015]MCO0637587.1 hypothetical protein [Lutimaribacter sp. EGI FJ00014]
MLKKTTRVALLGSVAALAFSTAHAQTNDPSESNIDTEACVTLAERLASDVDVDAEVRTEVEDVIATGDVTQCQVLFTAWEREGTVTRESLEMVGTDTVTQRMVVQQEIEVDADVAVYQPPAEVDVDTGTPEVSWSMPRQTLTIDEQAPQIIVRQGRATVNVEVPQPRVSVMFPEPEIIVTWPDSTIDMSEISPKIEVRIPEPKVTVNMPDPVIELTIGGSEPADLVELDDGRFAPKGATKEDLQPRISIQQREAKVTPNQEAKAPEIVVNRGEPKVTYEGEEPEVSVEIIGEPEIRVSPGQRDGEANVTIRSDAAEREERTRLSQEDDQISD